jgi:hypothetical protein
LSDTRARHVKGPNPGVALHLILLCPCCWCRDVCRCSSLSLAAAPQWAWAMDLYLTQLLLATLTVITQPYAGRLNKHTLPCTHLGAPLQFCCCVVHHARTTATENAPAAVVAVARRLLLALRSWLLCLWRPCWSASASTATGARCGHMCYSADRPNIRSTVACCVPLCMRHAAPGIHQLCSAASAPRLPRRARIQQAVCCTRAQLPCAGS